MQKTTDETIALVALIAFAAWLLVALPLIYMPGEWHSHGEIFGVKYGEWLLFLATMALFWATWQLVRGAEQTAERQLRAYVFMIESKVLNFKVGEIVDIELCIKNTGETPAYDLVSVSEPHLNDASAPVLPSVTWSTELSKSALGPGCTIYPRSRTKVALQQEWLDAIVGRGSAYYIVGEIRYRDAFKNPRATSFRLMFTGRSIERNATSLKYALKEMKPIRKPNHQHGPCC